MSAPISIRREIAAPREVVFTLAADFRRAAETIGAIERVEMLTDGPVGVGTRFRETRTMFGRPATEEMTVAEFEPPRSYLLVAESHGARYESRLEFEPTAGGGTAVTMSFTVAPRTFFARLFAALSRPMMKRMVAICARDLDDLAVAAERETARSS